MGFRVNSGTVRPEPVTFLHDAAAIPGYPGETVAAALIAANIRGFRRDLRGRLRGPYCNMGTCFECVLEVRTDSASGAAQDDGGSWRTVRACLTPIRAGLETRSPKSPGLEDPSP